MKQKLLTLVLLTVCMMAVISGLAVYAHATPITDETSNAFFNSCVQKRDERMTEQNQTKFCACSAAKMQENMSLEETRAMFQPGQQGRLMLNKMLTEVYAPCMNFPVQDLITANCMNDPKVASFSKDNNPAPLCTCMGKETGNWFAANGPQLLARILADNPNVTDPITPVMESNVVKQQSFKFLMRCSKMMQ